MNKILLASIPDGAPFPGQEMRPTPGAGPGLLSVLLDGRLAVLAAYAERALAAEPSEAEGHFAMALVHLHHGDLHNAQAELRLTLDGMGRHRLPAHAVQALQQAVDQLLVQFSLPERTTNALLLVAFLDVYAAFLWRNGRSDEAVRVLASTVHTDPYRRTCFSDLGTLWRRRAPLAAGVEESLRGFFDRMALYWEQGLIAAPSNSDPRADGPDLRLQRKYGWAKVLIVSPRHIDCNPKFVEHDLTEYLHRSGLRFGLNIEVHYADLFMYPEFNKHLTFAERRREVDALKERIIEGDYSFLLFDGNHMGTPDTLNHQDLREIREKSSIRIGIFIPDLFDSYHFHRVDYWDGVTDLMVTFNSLLPLGAERYSEKLVCLHVPCVDGARRADPPAKTLDVAFVGTTARYLREAWLACLGHAGIDCYVSGIDRRLVNAPDLDGYIDLMARSRIMLNFTSRHGGLRVLTGRLFEGINGESLVLEEDGGHAARFFAPYVHYVPFRTIDELVTFIRFFQKNPDYRERIAAAGKDWADRKYCADWFWGPICDRLLHLPGR